QLTFPCGTLARLTASRAAISPRRDMHVWWRAGLAQLDFAARRSASSLPTADFFRAGARLAQPQPHEIAALQAEMHGRYFTFTEKAWSGGPELLALELEHFVACVRERTEPRVNGERGRDAVWLGSTVLEAARRFPDEMILPPAAPSRIAA